VQATWITVTVQLGFVVGAVVSAVLNVSDLLRLVGSSQPQR
jgi:hypothetical protein